MTGLTLPFSGGAAADDPNVVLDIQCVGDGIAIKGDSVGAGTAIQASGGADQGGSGGVALEAISILGGTAVRAHNDSVNRDGAPGRAVEAIADQGGVAVAARTSGTDHQLTDAGNMGNAGVGVDAICDSGGTAIQGESSGRDNDGNAGPGIAGTSEHGVGVRPRVRITSPSKQRATRPRRAETEAGSKRWCNSHHHHPPPADWSGPLARSLACRRLTYIASMPASTRLTSILTSVIVTWSLLRSRETTRGPERAKS